MLGGLLMKKILIFLLLTAVSFSLFAQYGTPVAILEYYDDDLELEITGADGVALVDIYYGMDLEEGDTIRTNRTGAELRLDPNGSIIKLSPFTVFTIENLQKSENDSNDFNLISGKIHAIAARAGFGERYQIRTQSAVCGVRGTDFGVISLPGSVEKAFVIDGLIDYTNSLTNQKIQLGSGMLGDALAEVFQAIAASAEQMNDLVKDVLFEQLDPAAVPGHGTPEKVEEVVEAQTAESQEPVEEEPKELSEKEIAESAMMKAISDILGLEIGTVTIDGDTYSKAIIQPTFNIGKLKLSLYLPVVYQTDLFDPEDWYHPEGNNEWSFGTDQDGYTDIALDALSDLFLKIRYVEWGEQRDPFFFKVGNINSVTLGHGILMQDFANDMDFPAIRRIGLNLGVDNGKRGFETVVNDLADPEIFGARLYLRPIGPLALGISSVVDIDPDKVTNDVTVPDDSVILAAAADLDFPLMENDILSLIFFADIAGMVPYMDGAFKDEMIFDSDTNSFRNYGWNAGLFGNILFVDYRLEYRYFDGEFRPAFFNSSYERLRGTYIKKISAYLASPTDTDPIMGIYGEGSFSLFGKINTTIGYMWPWDKNGPSEEDEFLFEVAIEKGTIPVIDIYGSVAYHRTKFIPTLMQSGVGSDLTLFDANTSFSGEVVYPLAPTLAIAAIVSTSMRTDKITGEILYKNGYPEMVPVITIETRIGF
ncbi:MAG: FecR domain-containing protein [Spirochaetales bacterium]|nr:FecR domain-containing protein [Spirochaetales bacterium]